MQKSVQKKLLKLIQGCALVTGGSSGIGKELAFHLSAIGVTVVVADINVEDGEAVAEAINSTGGIAHFVKLDVSDGQQFMETVEYIEAKIGVVDILFNNAGIGIVGEFIDLTPEDWKKNIEVNLFGVVNGVNAVYKKMIQRKRGNIVNVASLAGLYPLPAEGAYAASKYAVVGLTKVLMAEAKGYGIKVFLVCPGKIETPIYDTSEVRGFDKKEALKLWPEGISAKDCSMEILKGLASNSPTNVITPFAKLLWITERALPNVSSVLGGMYMNKMRKYRVE